jgi:hypothetical protein
VRAPQWNFDYEYRSCRKPIARKGNLPDKNRRSLRGGLAQLGERLLCKQEVSGSSPLISTN